MIRQAANICLAALVTASLHDFAGAAEDIPDAASAPPVTVFMSQWREPSVITLAPSPLPSFAAAPTPWRDARNPETDGDTTASLLYGRAPREFGVRVELSDTDTVFVKMISFRAIGLKTRALQSTPFVPQTMLDRASAKAFAAGVRMRF